MGRKETYGFLSVALASIIWGFNGVIINNIPIDAYATAFYRSLFGSLALLPVFVFGQRKCASGVS
ncbi:MAG: EamA family transporter [Thermoproteota archaeon]